MIFLIACILSSSSIFVLFRLAGRFQCRLSEIILYNYLTATLLGLLFFKPLSDTALCSSPPSWLGWAVLLGILFIAMFFLIGRSSQKAGISVTTMANKLSLVFPVLFSLLAYQEKLTLVKLLALTLAFVAILLTIYRKDLKETRVHFIYLPLIIFVGSGLIDTLVKYAQAEKITADESPIYTTIVFAVASICNVLILVFQHQKLHLYLPTFIIGIALGLSNFGSLYFMINALNHTGLPSSLVFTLNNMSVVAITALVGRFFFHETMNRINFVGIVLALASLYLLMN